MKFLAIETLIVSSILLSISSLSSAQSNQQGFTILPTGAYYAQGTMFNNSRREIAHQNNRICIKIVDGPANPYKGVESITISSVSVENGKYYIDATGTELVLKNNGKAFSGDIRGTWDYRGTSPDRRSQPIQAKKMAECVAAQGRYVEKMEGISISGIDFPKH
ncbi:MULTISPECIES: hypothetical protein [unclassified Microcoleus]|uniref:hypothetical protein n=1 Tax=unclassified Microcoleus TaxID=2642155 RepID=UPI002FD66619